MRDALVVLGGSISQRTLVERARARGLATCVVDGRAVTAAGAIADVAVHQDFSDTAGVRAALETAGVRAIGVAGMGSDLAVAPAARLAAALDLPALPPDVVQRATDKRAMRSAFEAADVPSPAAREPADRSELARAYRSLGPSVVVKPADGSAQRGVSAVHDAEALERAFERAVAASRSGRVIVERYVDGDEFTANGFVVDGTYRLVTLTRRVLHDPPPLGVCLAHRFPAGVPAADADALVEAARAATAAVGIDGAPSYAQLRLGPEGPAVIEVGARLGGGKDAELGLLLTGVDAVGAVIDAALGRLGPASLRPVARPVAACGQVAFLVRPPGRIERLDERAALARPGVHEVGWYFAEGQDLPSLRSGADRLGYLIVTADAPDELRRRTDEAVAALGIEIATGAPAPAAA